MAEPNEQYAYFTLRGDFDPRDITKRIGLLPTDSWRKGEIDPRLERERRFSRWSLRSRLPNDQSLEKHMADVLSQLDGQAEVATELSIQFQGCMQLVGYFLEDYPGLHFDRALTEGLARYALAVDCDFYFLYSHRREDTD